MRTIETRKELPTIDVIKFIMAFGVVAIHSAACLNQEYVSIFQWFIRCAVPFFFITSGFLLERKLEKSDEVFSVCLDRSKKLLRLFGIWLLIYLPITIFIDTVNDKSFFEDLVRYIYSVLLFGESEYSWPLWFIYSSAIVVLIYGFCRKQRVHIMAVFLVFTVISVFAHYIAKQSDMGYVGFLTKSLCSRLFGGGSPLLLGVVIYRYRQYLQNYYVAIIALVVSLIGYYLALPLSSLFGGMFFFILGLTIPLKPLPIYLWFRSQSMWIYYLHMWILFLLVSFLKVADVRISQVNVYLGFLVVSIITFGCTIVVNYLQSKDKFRLLGILIK